MSEFIITTSRIINPT